MYETVKFWEDIGVPLLKMEELPGGGQHSFHDMGNGAMLSYMTFADAPARAPGIASQPLDFKKDGAKTAIASMNHIALDGIDIEGVTPADDNVHSVYEYLIGGGEESQ